MDQPVEGVDARADRVAQGVVGITLLAAFVFRVPWLVPGLAVVLGVGALAGPKANLFHVVFQRVIAPRLPRPGDTVAEPDVTAPTVRTQDGLAAVVLVVSEVAFLLGIHPVGWLLAIAVAVVAIVAATTRVHLADRVLGPLRPRRPKL